MTKQAAWVQITAASAGPPFGSFAEATQAAIDAEVARLSLDCADAVLCDLDGVLTDTASLHQVAWSAVFTELFERTTASGDRPAPFTSEDYRHLVDGEPRLDAVRNVLASRQLALPEGQPGDEPGFATMQAVAAVKDARFAALLAEAGPRPFPGSARMLLRLRADGDHR